MRASFELHSITCHTPKSSEDALKVYFGVVTDGGQGDTLESASEESIANPVERGPYELHAGDTLELDLLPPIGRANWRTATLSFSAASRISWNLSGMGLHKAELGGGSNPDSLYAKVLERVRESFLGILGIKGAVIEALLDFAEDVTASAAQNNCLGGLFSFSGEYRGADLTFALIRDGSIRLYPDSRGGPPLTVHEDCRQPHYAAFLQIDRQTRIIVTTTLRQAVKANGPHFTVTAGSFPKECKPSAPMAAWVVQQENTFEAAPSLPLQELTYVWELNGQELRATDQGVTLPIYVGRYEPLSSSTFINRQEDVTISYAIDPSGWLRLTCPHTSGNYEIRLTCKVRSGTGEIVTVHSESRRVESEYLDGNEAYRDYIDCVRGYWRALQGKMRELSRQLVRAPQEIPHYDPAESLNVFDDMILKAERIITEIKGLRGGRNR